MPISIDHATSANDQLMHSGWLTYAGVLGISVWGGVTRYLSSEGPFSWKTLAAQLFSSSFAGAMTFLACQYAGISGPLTGVMCGVAAHMGTPAIIALAMRLKVVRNALEDNTK